MFPEGRLLPSICSTGPPGHVLSISYKVCRNCHKISHQYCDITSERKQDPVGLGWITNPIQSTSRRGK
uniref:Uncharacterized protein n=1 Tax=Arundo donax TaxID=35708 RepID=A0A0A9G8X2_ARUDO